MCRDRGPVRRPAPGPALKVLNWATLNRTLLARQLLLERADLTPEQAVERVGGLQTQYAPSAYIGLWSRLARFRREDLTDALARRRIVQGWVMRGTIHMVSAADYAPLTEAVREQRRRGWLRTQIYGLADTWLRLLPHVDPDAAQERLVSRYLRGFGPATPGDVARYAGWTVTGARAVLDRLTLHGFRDPDGGALVDLPRAPIVDAVPTFLVDGRVAGTWRYTEGRASLSPFEPLPTTVRDEVEAEAERLAAFHRPARS